MKLSLISLGCPRTLVDSEVILGGLLQSGDYQLSEHMDNSDVAIVNTCAFTQEAVSESLETIFKLAQLKKEGRVKAVVVVGCLSQRYPEALKKGLTEVDGIIGTSRYEDLPKILEPLQRRQKVFDVQPRPGFLLSEKSPRKLLTPPHFAYVKISEGCINSCSYCVIPKIKGPHRSRPMESILDEIRQLTDRYPLSEINLVGQDTAAYGRDLYGTFRLPELLTRVAGLKCVPWIRLLYAHPGHVTDNLIEVMASEPSLCRYVDLPIEHSHDAVLKRMNRGVTRSRIVAWIEKLRKRLPEAAIRTTVIVGFPGETDEEFQDLLSFLREIRFDRLGAFEYSREEGSDSYNMEYQIPLKVKHERFDAVMREQQKISSDLNEQLLDKTLEVLIDEKVEGEEGIYHGRTEKDAPEVDGQVIVHSSQKLSPGDFVKVRIVDTLEYDLVGYG